MSSIHIVLYKRKDLLERTHLCLKFFTVTELSVKGGQKDFPPFLVKENKKDYAVYEYKQVRGRKFAQC